METPVLIFSTSLLICISGVLFYLNAEKNTFNQVLISVQEAKAEARKSKIEIDKINLRIDEYRTIVMKQRAEVETVQDHCSRIREQQQILNRRQQSLKEKMIPSRFEISIIDEVSKPKAKKPNPELINKIKKQLKDLN